jgi:hypothetical protein
VLADRGDGRGRVIRGNERQDALAVVEDQRGLLVQPTRSLPKIKFEMDAISGMIML